MNTPVLTDRDKHHRFPAGIISHGVWLYDRFCLRYRDVEELLFARGSIVTYEAIRKWCVKFGRQYAHQLRRRRPQRGDKWHLNEVFLTTRGERHDLWWAVDQDGPMLDILVPRRRDKKAAKKFFRKVLKGCDYVPRLIITDQLKSHGSAKREILPGVEHRQHRYVNNRAENLHQPRRQREWRMQGFKSPGHAQSFLSAYGPIVQHFRPRRHRLSASAYWQEMGQRCESWQAITYLPTAAYSPSPSGRGRGEGQRTAGRGLVGAILPYAEVKTALRGKTGGSDAPCRLVMMVTGNKLTRPGEPLVKNSRGKTIVFLQGASRGLAGVRAYVR